MKSYLGLMLALIILLAVIGTGAVIWYSSYSSEYSRMPETPATR